VQERSFHRLAEVVADHMRTRILSGELEDGSLLPKEEDLRELYPVSKPTFRESMRILESEGLVSVRRGNVGGAIVHRPTARHVAYTMGLVLASEQVTIDEVALALRQIEPACAALCAGRRDRARAVVPELRRLQAQYEESINDLVAVVGWSREFHEALVRLCGNRPLMVMASALERMWSAHEKGWASRIAESDPVKMSERVAAGRVHARMIELIATGDADGVARIAVEHLAHAQRSPKPKDGRMVVDPALVRQMQPDMDGKFA
jgi:DNA-binding FadR family transcriptional regulator